MGGEHGTVDNHRALPVRFVPYALAAWTGTRRLDFWQYSADSSHAAQLWLGHDGQRTSLAVGTCDPLDLAVDSLDLAEEVMVKLVNIGLPGPQALRTEGFGRRLVDHAMTAAARRAEWPTVTVSVDGRPARMRYQVFAGCWAGVVDGHPIGLYGTGNRLGTLTLVPFADTTPYGFDVTTGVRFIDMREPDSWPRLETGIQTIASCCEPR